VGKRVLVVEDDAAIRRGLVDALRFQGYEVLEAGDGHAGLAQGLTAGCDLLLLDLVLPGVDGLQILRQVRLAQPTCPVIVLTARGEEDDRVRGLRLGADDYVVKPFGLRELLARVEAVLRRSPERPRPASRLRFPWGRADLGSGDVQFDSGEHARLLPLEADLLRYLAAHAGRTVSRDEILSHVWRSRLTAEETRTVDVHVARLRDKLREDERHRLVLTVRGQGYRLAEGAELDEAGP
jgi:DNA-binding response OmpR family regulator